MLTDQDMVTGQTYRLAHEVTHEHQDHWFIYPAGMLVRLDFVHTLYDEDRAEYIFSNPASGMNDSFNPEELDWAEGTDYLAHNPGAVMLQPQIERQ